MLEIDDLYVAYGRITAVKGISLHVAPGEIVALIGANGAGKTTTLRAISGLLRPSQGQIRFADERIDRLPEHQIVRLGLAHCPEGRHIFASLSVAENLRMGAIQRRDRAEVARDYAAALDMFPALKPRQSQLGATLSGGEQQMLAIARALMSRPRLLLLDEPSLGLAPLVVTRIFETIAHLRAQGVTVLLVEQNARKALEIADRAYVLETGQVAMQGSAAELRGSERVRQAYLGG
jgi:branched-chain amino acid transport system ATP-binding protein